MWIPVCVEGGGSFLQGSSDLPFHQPPSVVCGGWPRVGIRIIYPLTRPPWKHAPPQMGAHRISGPGQHVLGGSRAAHPSRLELRAPVHLLSGSSELGDSSAAYVQLRIWAGTRGTADALGRKNIALPFQQPGLGEGWESRE